MCGLNIYGSISGKIRATHIFGSSAVATPAPQARKPRDIADISKICCFTFRQQNLTGCLFLPIHSAFLREQLQTRPTCNDLSTPCACCAALFRLALDIGLQAENHMEFFRLGSLRQ
jgi:hypothetical protein